MTWRSFGSVLLTATLGVAQAQESEPDTTYAEGPVLVTATRATQQISPVTFSTLERADIRSLYSTQDIPVILSRLPSITFYSENGNGIGYTYINLRGFDQRRISVMINGIPQNDPEDHNVYWIDFPDLLANAQDIQVQRGAGSAFYGPPAIGGSINLVANPFHQRPRISVELLAGFQEFGADNETRLNTRKQSITLNSGWVDQTYMFYGRLGRLQSDGYRDHGWVDMTSYFLGALRTDENMTTRIHVYGGPIADGLVYIGLPKSYNADLALRRTNYSYWEYDQTGTAVGYAVPQKRQALENFSQPHVEILHDWSLTDDVEMHTAAFFIKGDGFFDYDGDWIPYTPAAVDWFTTYVGYDSTFGVSSFPSFLFRGVVENRQWGVLPRIDWDHPGGRLTIGLEARFHRSKHYGRIQFASLAPSSGFDQGEDVYAYEGVRDILSAYVHESWNLTPAVSVVGDVQVVYNRYGIRNEKFLGNSFNLTYMFVNPRAGVNVAMTEAWHGYAFVGYTSREPRLRNLYAAEDAYFGATPEFQRTSAAGAGGAMYDFSSPLAKPEQLLDLEAGIGYHAPSLRFTSNVFWMEFTDELVASGQVDVFGQPVTGNAARTRHIGIEVEAESRLFRMLSLSGNISLSRNRHIKYTSYETGTAVAFDGNPIAGFPDLIANVHAAYDRDGTTVGIDVQHVGDFYTDNTKNPLHRNDAYTTVSARVLQRIDVPWGMSMVLRGEVRNLLNALYTTGGQGNAFFPAAERNYVLGITVDM